MSLLTLFASTAATPAPFDPGSLFASSEAGYIAAGYVGGSSFYEEDTLTTPATASGTDPVGGITDLSPNSNPLINTASAQRAVYYADGNGIKSWRIGTISATNRWLRAQTDVFAGAAFTVVSVYKYLTDDATNAAPIVSTYVDPGNWGAGGYCLLRASGADSLDGLCDADPGDISAITGGAITGSPVIAVWKRSGTGVNQTTLTSYSMAGTQVATATSTQDATPAKPIANGYAGAVITAGVTEQAFQLVIDRALTPTEIEDLVGLLVQKLGAWA